MILFQNSLVILSFEEAVPCFKFNHLKPLKSDELKEIWHKALEVINDLKKKYPDLVSSLMDTRQLGTIAPELINYLNTVIDPVSAMPCKAFKK
jgi:hypothetical protein